MTTQQMSVWMTEQASLWRTDQPPCPRCGLTLHVDDPCVGYHPDADGPIRLRHGTSTFTPDADGCVIALGRAVGALNDRLAELEHYRPLRYARRRLVVLNNDSVICEHCYEDAAPSETEPDTDPGLMPMGDVTEGECSVCGYRLPVIDQSD